MAKNSYWDALAKHHPPPRVSFELIPTTAGSGNLQEALEQAEAKAREDARFVRAETLRLLTFLYLRDHGIAFGGDIDEHLASKGHGHTDANFDARQELLQAGLLIRYEHLWRFTDRGNNAVLFLIPQVPCEG